MKKPNHKKRARKAMPHILSVVAQHGVTGYKELCDKIGLHHRTAQWFLGVIQTWCRKNGLPPLQAVVVNQKTRLPGNGYTATCRQAAAHRRALEKVWAFDWSKAPKF